MSTRGVLLVNTGSPDSPEVADVRRYLGQFLMDGRVLDQPWPLRKLVVSGFILPRRPQRSARRSSCVTSSSVVRCSRLSSNMRSMISSPVPTRAEVSDVANAVLDGTDAVMLSAETAAGKYPVETVTSMAQVCVEAEKSDVVALDRDFLDRTFTRIDQSIAMATLFTAFHLNAKAIVSLTQSGSTALWMSRLNAGCPIYALTPEVASQRKMALYRNVRPLFLEQHGDRDAVLKLAEELLVSTGKVQDGDMMVLTIGEPLGKSGGTNTMKLVRVGDDRL